MHADTYGLEWHWGLKGHFYKTSLLAIFGDSLMMGSFIYVILGNWHYVFTKEPCFIAIILAWGKLNVTLAISEQEQNAS